MNNTLLKIATFTLFVGLVGTFVAYKAGFWGVVDGSIQLSPNGSAINANGQDSTAVDSMQIPEKLVILPSSKSFQVGDDFFINRDTLKVENEDSVKKKKKNKGKEKDVIMPSSKSGPMFN